MTVVRPASRGTRIVEIAPVPVSVVLVEPGHHLEARLAARREARSAVRQRHAAVGPALVEDRAPAECGHDLESAAMRPAYRLLR